MNKIDIHSRRETGFLEVVPDSVEVKKSIHTF